MRVGGWHGEEDDSDEGKDEVEDKEKLDGGVGGKMVENGAR